MRKYKIFFLIFVFCLLPSVFCLPSYANNISVANASLGAQDTSLHTMIVQFNINQDNAWYDAVNYDAAWVFIKYSTDSGTTWAHATLKVTDANNLTSGVRNPAGFSRGTAVYSGSSTNVDIDVPTEATSGKKGAFVHLSAVTAGSGTNTLTVTGLQFVWDWGSDKLSNDPNTAITAATTALVKVFAVEMAYVPTGTFEAGSSGTGSGEFIKTQINTANATTAPSGSPLAGGYPSGQSAPTNASWPNGYSAFYIMKYDISQGQWVDFFNTLISTQKPERDITGNHATYGGKNADTALSRNTVSWTSGDASAGANQYVGCNYLCWSDQTAYADWAGLRPMTELEYEKACRGTVPAVADEYAWGSTAYTQVTGITNSGLINETASGNLSYSSGVAGPMRCGFAATSSSTRAQAGASYYGVMELSGNLWKRPVTIGGAFTGLHGDGALDATGNANVTGWPGTGASGAGFRGGAWSSVTTLARVSGRISAANGDAIRNINYGGRCVRTSP